jgi:galactonate dehydratase
MALFDAVGKAADAPIHALLGAKVRERAAISWWDYDLPPSDLAAECQLAAASGYTSFKTKSRPWFDVYEQMEQVSKVTPDGFHMDLDFNGMLMTADHAERVLPDLAAKFPIVTIYETPIPQRDVAGGKRIQQITDIPIAHHYGSPSITVQLTEDLCDGFVLGGSARQVMQQGAVCAATEKPFWLQQVGTGLTAAFSLHFAAVLEWAKWPAVNCHQLYENDLLKTKLVVKEGTTEIPDAPGLGVDLDLDAVNAYRIERPKSKPMGPDRLMRVVFSSGETWYYAYGRQYEDHAMRGGMPIYERGVRLEMIPDDGSSRWRELRQRALKGPVKESL